MDQEAARLQAILTQAREDAQLTGVDVGLRIEPRGYGFLRYNTRTGQWLAVTDDPMLRQRSLPAGLNIGLLLEGRSIDLNPTTSSSVPDPLQPHVVVQASGDLAPFDIVFTRDGTAEVRRLTGTVDGKFEIHDDARQQVH